MIALALLTAVPVVLDCHAAQLRLSADGRDGAFNGMSHGGTLLVLRNVGRHACRVPGLPRVTFQDRHGRALPALRRVPVGMHPGPVISPVTIPAHGSVNVPLRWVSGPVYDRNRCVVATRMSVTIGQHRLYANGGGQLCGEAGKTIGFDQPVLTGAAYEG